MKLTHRWRILGALLLAAVLLGILFVWNMGAVLVAPSNHRIGMPPVGLRVENVEFPIASGATIYGWFVAGKAGQGAVVLMHGSCHARQLR